jgi:serine phosphatase RsbU (regulator of sigma subunit)
VNLRRSFRQDLKELYQFYLDSAAKNRLAKMSRWRRWFHIALWLLKSLFFKLAPNRRLLLVIALFCYYLGNIKIEINDNVAVTNIGHFYFLLLLIILMLELKDKLLAQDELAVGRAVQRTFIPHENPQLPGWEIWLYTQPANEVSGDLVDYFLIKNNVLQLTLADVAGKGLGAALLMSKLQSSLRALAPHFPALANLGREVNQILCRDGLPNRFASLVYLEITADLPQVRLLNAGHLPPIIFNKQRFEEYAPGNPALGLNAAANFSEGQLSLTTDDLICIYSDGVTESQNSAGQFFGEARLFQLLKNAWNLPVKTIGQRILNEVAIFSAEARQYDDLSLILMRYTGRNQTSGIE